ncbi:MAG: IS4 family transposase, partial [Burkholderiales bacterium]
MHPIAHKITPQQRRIKRQLSNCDSYAFFNLLTGPELFETAESLLSEHRGRLFPPTETLSLFLTQALSADRSCQKAVDEVAVKRVVAGLKRCSARTGAYCRARKRLTLNMVRTLACHTGGWVTRQAPEPWRWRGRAVRLV